MRACWQAHGLSNAGDNGSNRLLSRRQLLADGTETDACSGNIAKHHHAVLLAEYQEANGISLCPACRSRDGRRAAALVEHPDYKRNLTLQRVLQECGLCDAHGFLITAKKASKDGATEARQRLSKHTLIEFSFALALPDQHAESMQVFTRVGDSKDDGQMVMKMPTRSGQYALCVRYKCVGIGVDTDSWVIALDDAVERTKRHRAILEALRDQMLSPSGALTATMLPHLSGLSGAIVIRQVAGRAPIYSPLEPDFVTCLESLASDSCRVVCFGTVDEFNTEMNKLVETTEPSLPIRSSPSEKIQKVKSNKAKESRR
jgi:CRISPR-associated autoregulator DevR family